jgi:alpha-mannosidase
MGLRTFPVAEQGAGRRTVIPNRVRSRRDRLENGLTSVVVADGALRVEAVRSHTVSDILAVEIVRDLGDLYTASLRGEPLRVAPSKFRRVQAGPLLGSMAIAWRAPGDAPREWKATIASVEAEISIHADSPLVRIRATGSNRSRDSRLRFGIRTGVQNARVFADAALGVVERVPLIVGAEDSRMETPPPTAPLHRYVTLLSDSLGATVFSDGLAEYEADDDGVVWITLVRAVGELSRNDLPERRGHAGWPAPTPEAQMQGTFEAEFALLLHYADHSVELIERAAEDFVLPLASSTIRAAGLTAGSTGVELRGANLARAVVKRCERDGRIVVRCTNMADFAVEGEWVFPAPVNAAWRARLDETELEPL